MNKVDELIDALAEHIKKRIDEGNDMENEITEKTKALAELVSVRGKEIPIDWKKLMKAKEEFEKITGIQI